MSEENETRWCQIKMEDLEKLFSAAKSADLTQSQFEEHKTRRIEHLSQVVKNVGTEKVLMDELLKTINSEWKPYNPFYPHQ